MNQYKYEVVSILPTHILGNKSNFLSYGVANIEKGVVCQQNITYDEALAYCRRANNDENYPKKNFTQSPHYVAAENLATD